MEGEEQGERGRLRWGERIGDTDWKNWKMTEKYDADRNTEGVGRGPNSEGERGGETERQTRKSNRLRTMDQVPEVLASSSLI